MSVMETLSEGSTERRRIGICVEPHTATYVVEWASKTLLHSNDDVYLIHVEADAGEYKTTPLVMGISKSISMSMYDPSERRAMQDSHFEHFVHPFVEKLKPRTHRTRAILLRSHDPRDVLLEEISRQNLDMVVAGSRGHSRARQLLLGSVSNYLTSHCHCPVIVVPPPPASSSSHGKEGENSGRSDDGSLSARGRKGEDDASPASH